MTKTSKRELRFWPLLFGVYAFAWGLEALISRLEGLPLAFSLDLTFTDLAIFGIVVGVWLLASAIRNETSSTSTQSVDVQSPISE